MLYALIKNNSVSVYPYSISEFRKDNPNVSLPETPTEQQLNEVDIYIVAPTPQPEYNKITENCTEVTPEYEEDRWRRAWVITPASEAEISFREQQAKEANKKQASALLSATDWTTIPDVSDPTKSDPYLSNVTDFVVYRNAVRKIAISPPVTVSAWPVLPEEVWVGAPVPPMSVDTQEQPV